MSDYTAYNEEVKKKLGDDNYNSILDAAKSHKINKNHMRDLAYSLGQNIGGDHLRRVEGNGKCNEYEIRQILCHFYSEEMFGMSSEDAVKKLDELFKDVGIVCPVVNCRKSRKSSKGASPKKKQRSKTVSVSNLNIYIDSTRSHSPDLKSPSFPSNKKWTHSNSDNAVLTISQKLDEKLLEMKCKLEQAEKESKVLQDALHPFDDWLRLVEHHA